MGIKKHIKDNYHIILTTMIILLGISVGVLTLFIGAWFYCKDMDYRVLNETITMGISYGITITLIISGAITVNYLRFKLRYDESFRRVFNTNKSFNHRH